MLHVYHLILPHLIYEPVPDLLPRLPNESMCHLPKSYDLKFLLIYNAKDKKFSRVFCHNIQTVGCQVGVSNSKNFKLRNVQSYELLEG